MKQKYVILKNHEKKELVIKEFAELDKDILSLLCEEKYTMDSIESVLEKGKDALISKFRTVNMYPPGIYASEIADRIMDLFNSKEEDSTELFFDDSNLFAQNGNAGMASELESGTDDIDDLLDVDVGDEFSEDIGTKKLNSTIKIADDETAGVDDD